MQRRRVSTDHRLRLFDPGENRVKPILDVARDDVPGASVEHAGEGRATHSRAAGDRGTLFLPQGYEPKYRYPLLVWLPESRSSRFDLGRVMSQVSFRNHVAILPSGLPQALTIASPCSESGVGSPRVSDVESCIWEAVTRADQEASINPSRIFLVGQGDGGTEAFRIGCRHADLFGGVISIGGEFPEGEAAFARLASVRRLPMLLCCRQSSDTARGLDRTLRLFHAAGGTLAVRLYPSAGMMTSAMLGDVNRWVMEQVCDGSESRCTVPN